MKLWKIGALAIGIIGIMRYVATPPPGQSKPDLGREHVSQEKIAAFAYNSNPPTSGPHDPDWIKSGVYIEPQNEGKLIHSLEHGYVVISYNCQAEQCKMLIKQLEDVVREKKLKKLILVPRKNLDTKIALTAWTYIDTFNDFDAKHIERFIDYHRDQGPEKTME
jgi:hypothetical protein